MNSCQQTIILSLMLASLSACNPTVRLQAPEKPIEINMNITIDIRIAVDKELDAMLTEDSGLF